MSYQILPNITFILSVLGIVLVILKNLPQAATTEQGQPEHIEAERKLVEKGLPAQAISRVKVGVLSSVKHVWNFVLEAKDLKPHAAVGYQMKKIFGGKLPSFSKPVVNTAVVDLIKDEKYFLEQIKLYPKDLRHYDNLGKYYLEKENTSDAKDIYQYLVNHQPTNPDYQARLAYCQYQSKNFIKAAEHYEKSVALDSTQPNRYYNLGLSLEAAGKPSDAQKALKKALAMEPENPKFQQAAGKTKK